MKKLAVVTILAVWLALPVLTLAQDATPAPIRATPEVSLRPDQPVPIAGFDGFDGDLPAAATLGDGWVVRTSGLAPPSDGPVRYVVEYASRQGDRVTVAVTPYGSVSAALDVYAATDELLDAWQGPLAQDDDELSRSDLAELPDPDGCDRTSRVEGREAFTGYPVGATLCLSERQSAVVLVVASGVVRQGGEELRLHAASDVVMVRTLASLAGGATGG